MKTVSARQPIMNFRSYFPVWNAERKSSSPKGTSLTVSHCKASRSSTRSSEKTINSSIGYCHPEWRILNWTVDSR